MTTRGERRQRKRVRNLQPLPNGVTATADTLRIKLDGEYREAVGLSKIRAWLDSDRGFAHLTTFNRNRDFMTNLRPFERLPQDFRALAEDQNIWAYWLIGHRTGRTTSKDQAKADQHHADYLLISASD
jgi:hypothetical protein